MKRNLHYFALAILVLSAICAFAADVTGQWAGTTKGPDGGDFTLTISLKQDGAKLTGTVGGPQGEPVEITDGKVEGDKLSFNVSFNGMTIIHEGVIKGDNEIALTARFPKETGIPDMQVNLKRTK